MRLNRLAAVVTAAALGIAAPLVAVSAAHADSDEGYLIGTVTDNAGHPLPAASVSLTSTSGDSASGYTDRNGRYVAEFSQDDISDGGTWTATASAGGMVTSTHQAFTPPTVGANASGPTIALAPQPFTPDMTDVVLTGTVSTPNGTPHFGRVNAYDPANGRLIDEATIEPNGSYYFYGDSTPGDYSVNGRAVKLEFVVYGYESTFYGGGLAKSTSPAVSVPAFGQPALTVNGAVIGEGTITGAVKLPAAGANWSAEVSIYDADGNPVDFTDTDAAGNFSIDLAPGSYYVRADGSTWSTWTPTGSTSPEYADSYRFLAGYYGGTKAVSLATAKKIVVGSNGTVSVGTITLTNAYHALQKPFIKAPKGIHKGAKLSVGRGVWNHSADTHFTYVWKVGKKTLSTKAKLKITKKVWKKLGNGRKVKKLTVTVTANDNFGYLVSGSSTQKVVKALAKEQRQAAKEAKKAQKHAAKVKNQTER